MARIDQIVAFGREQIEREPAITDERLRTRLIQEFAVERDISVVLLRSGLWPLAVVWSLLAGSSDSRSTRVTIQVDEAIRRLRQDG